MKAISTADILSAFDPIDRPHVVLPQLQWVPWPELEYLAWQHPQDARGYLLMQLPERSVGLVLHLTQTTGRGMCELCYGLDRSQGTIMATVESWQRPRTRYGFHVCAGLNCSETARGGEWVYRMHETIPVGRRIERLQERLEAVVRRVTGLQAALAVGAPR